MRVKALHSGNKATPGACELYRINMPFHYLNNSREWVAEYDMMRDVFADWFIASQYNLSAPAVHQFFNELDVLVLPRTLMQEIALDLVIEPFFEMADFYNVKVVYEVDDDFTNEHRVVIQQNMEEIAKRCAAVTVTTPFLAETMTRRLGIPAYVLPNFLAPPVWREGEIKRNLSSDKTLIWLSGSETHYQDWKVLEGVFPALLQKHPEAVIAICGFHPDYLQGMEGVAYMDGVDYRTYAQMVRQSDVVLAPVDPFDQFNLGKSPIKATEGQGAVRKVQNQFCGAAVIATDNPVYRLTIRNGFDGLLVEEHTPDAWFAALDKVLTDSRFRRSLQQNAYNTVWKKGRWDISRQWHLWADAYKKIVAQPKRKFEQVAIVGEGVMQ